MVLIISIIVTAIVVVFTFGAIMVVIAKTISMTLVMHTAMIANIDIDIFANDPGSAAGAQPINNSSVTRMLFKPLK